MYQRKLIFAILFIALAYTAFGQDNSNAFISVKHPTYNFKNYTDSISYLLGFDIGNNIITNDIDVNKEILVSAVKDALDRTDSVFTAEETKKLLAKFQQSMLEKQQEKLQQSLEKERKASEEFLAQNKTKAGVKVTESGLQYEVINEGSGDNPNADNTVEVHYTGKLLNGKVFDSSVQRGETAKFPLKNVIKGWTEGLQLMKPGAKYIFYIPSELAYGERGAGRDIPGGATLIFEVELISIEK